MKEYQISFDAAKLAYELGYRHTSRMGYVTQWYHPITKRIMYCGRTGRCNINTLYPIINQALLQMWLRDVHQIMVFADIHKDIQADVNDDYEWYPRIVTTTTVINYNNHDFKSYEYALEAGLIRALELSKELK